MLHRSNESVAICLKMYLRVIDSVTKHGKVSLDHFKSILKSNMNSYLNKEGGGEGRELGLSAHACSVLHFCLYVSVCMRVPVCVRACLNVILRASSVLHVDQEM